MSIPSNISMTVAVADPNAPTHVLKPNADGSLNIGNAAATAPVPITSAGGTVIATASPAVSTSIYASGDVIGTKMTMAGAARAAGLGGLLQGVSVFCKSAQTFSCDLLLFHTDPAASTFTDNAALAVAVADFDKLFATVHISDWTNLGTPSLAEALALAIPYKIASGQTDAYAVLVSRGTPTLASVSDIKVACRFLPD